MFVDFTLQMLGQGFTLRWLARRCLVRWRRALRLRRFQIFQDQFELTLYPELSSYGLTNSVLRVKKKSLEERRRAAARAR